MSVARRPPIDSRESMPGTETWIDKQFSPAVYASRVEAMRSGIFLRRRFQDGNTLRQLLKLFASRAATKWRIGFGPRRKRAKG